MDPYVMPVRGVASAVSGKAAQLARVGSHASVVAILQGEASPRPIGLVRRVKSVDNLTRRLEPAICRRCPKA